MFNVCRPKTSTEDALHSGVGFGICQRLLLQLCQLNPSDSLPQAFTSGLKSDAKAADVYPGVTLIMACRNMKRGEAARLKLLQWLDNHVQELQQGSTVDADHLRTFRASCEIQVAPLDLASFSSVLKFAEAMKLK